MFWPWALLCSLLDIAHIQRHLKWNPLKMLLYKARPKPGSIIWPIPSVLIPVVSLWDDTCSVYSCTRIFSGVPKEPNPDAVSFINSNNPLIATIREVRGVIQCVYVRNPLVSEYEGKHVWVLIFEGLFVRWEWSTFWIFIFCWHDMCMQKQPSNF